MLRHICGAAAIVAVSWAASATHADLNPGVIPPHSNAFGTNYAELAGEWWNWAFQFPIAENPITDPNGEFAHLGQEGKVWFLAGTFGETDVVRDVTVPTGKALFLPLVNGLFVVPEDGDNEADVRAIANEFVDGTSVLEATIDGVPLDNLFSYRAQSPDGGFVLSAPDGGLINDFGLPAGDRYPSVADGYWLLLAPLSQGEHVVSFNAAIGDPLAPDFATGVTYNLNMVGGKAMVVPEPATASIGAFGLLGLVFCDWRRRNV